MNKSNAGFLVFLGVAAAIAFGAFFLAPNIFRTGTELASDATPKTSMVDATAPSEDAVPDSQDSVIDAAEGEAEADDPTTAANSFVMPSFDLLRVEPDGSMVVAGKAEPGSRLDIMNGETVVASADIGSSGDFAVVLDTPLPAGDYQLTLQVSAKDGTVRKSEEVATVSIPDSAAGELLAMVSKPGKASRIIAQPTAAPADNGDEGANTAADSQDMETAQAASSPTKTASATQAPGETAAMPAPDAPERGAEMADEGAEEAGAGGATELASIESSSGNAALEVQTPALPGASSTLTTSAPQIAGEIDVSGVSQTSGSSPADAEVADAEDGAADSEGSTELAMVDPDTESEAASVSTPADASVRVDAVEIEGDRIFVAGSATAGYQVRVAADGEVIGTDRADESGRFIVEATSQLAVGDHTINADLMDKAGQRVLLRAAVPFNRPEGESLAAVAPAEPVAKASPAAGSEGSNGAEPGELVLPDIASLSEMRESAFQALSELKQMASASEAPEKEAMAAALEDAVDKLKSAAIADLPEDSGAEAKAIAQSMRQQAGSALAALIPESAGAVPDAGGSLSSGDQAEAIDRLMTGDLATVQENLSQAETALSQPADMSAVGVDSAKMAAATTDNSSGPKTILQAPLASTPGAVIIRRGDTLWQISRRTYGEGVRYTTIYVANRSQIQNPDRIKPGQVFSVPETPLENAEEMHKQLLDEGRNR